MVTHWAQGRRPPVRTNAAEGRDQDRPCMRGERPQHRLTVDVSSRASVHALVQTATALGEITGVIHAAGVSPSQASPELILRVDLYGTALVLEEFGNVIASGGAGVVIASQSGHVLGALTAQEEKALALTPSDGLLALPMLQLDQVKDSLDAYQLSKRGTALRVMSEAVRWGKRGARLNAISPGIIISPTAKDEMAGAERGGLPTLDQVLPGRARRHARRSRNLCRAPDVAGGRIHHWQRPPHGWRTHRCLPVR